MEAERSTQRGQPMADKPTYEELKKRVEELELMKAKRTRRAIHTRTFLEQYRLMAEKIHDVIWAVDMDFKHFFVSPSVKNLTGSSVDEVLQKPLVEHLTEESYALAMKVFQDELANETKNQPNPNRSITLDLEQYCKDGSTIWTEAKCAFLRDEQKRPIGMIGVTRDITARKRAGDELKNHVRHASDLVKERTAKLEQEISERIQTEQALKASEEKYRLVIENANEAILVVQEGMLKLTNPKATEVTGYTQEELCSRPITEFIHPDDRKMITENHFKRLRGEELPSIYPFRVVDKRGHVKWAEINAIVMPWEGKPATLNFLQDITERKHAEEELQRSDERLRTIFASSRDAMIVIDSKGLVELFNPAAESLFGRPCEEMLGRPLDSLMPERYRSRHAKDIADFFATGRPDGVIGRIVELPGERKNGTEFPMEISLSKGGDGTDAFVLGIMRDITERKLVEEEITRIRKLESLGILAAGLAHDFNNLLTPVLANIAIARTYGNLDPQICELLADAETSTLRAKGLTDQLLTFAKGGAPIKQPVDLSSLLRETASFALTGCDAVCEYSLADDLWPAEVDQVQIGQVVHNMVINAHQAMPQGGGIKIRAENLTLGENEHLNLKGGRYVAVSIQDEGHGIPQEQLSKIFDPFFTTRERGRGLGLSSCLSIITRHDGHVHVDSTEGVGTIFHFYLPASENQPETSEKAKGNPIKGEGHILLIDDEEIVRKATRGVLTRLGYRVRAAKDHESGVHLYQKAMEDKHPFDAVIMDLEIPRSMGGREAIKKLKTMDRDVKAIVSSGYSDDRTLSKFREHGFCGVLAKPYAIEDLARLLHNVLNGDKE